MQYTKGVVRGQAWIDGHKGMMQSAAMGDEMYIATVNRDRGLSPKADLDDLAQSIQSFGGIRDPDDTMRRYLVMVFNVRWNPAYQSFGPATTRLRAVSRCVHLGALAFWQELVAFQRTIMQKR